MEFKLPTVAKTKWVKALRSGEFRQARQALVVRDFHGEAVGHCCLGVACEIGITTPAYNDRKNFVAQKFLPMNVQQQLANMNDGRAGEKQHSFKKIATWIEKNL